MKIGDNVMWNSQAGGKLLGKVGVIVAVVPPGVRPAKLDGSRRILNEDIELPDREYLVHKLGGGMARKEESYLIAVDNILYWPVVRILRQVNMSEEVDLDKLKTDTLAILGVAFAGKPELRDVEWVWMPKAEFDQQFSLGHFVVGPFRSTFGDGEGEPYQPHRPLYGQHCDGRWLCSST